MSHVEIEGARVTWSHRASRDAGAQSTLFKCGLAVAWVLRGVKDQGSPCAGAPVGHSGAEPCGYATKSSVCTLAWSVYDIYRQFVCLKSKKRDTILKKRPATSQRLH